MVQQLAYFSNQFHENIFTEDKLKYSFPEEFNDILDTQILLTNDAINMAIKSLKQTSHILLDRSSVEYSLDILKTICILCLICKNPLDLITSNMWGLYAGKGSGFAIVFDLEAIYSRDKINNLDSSEYINPVTYTSKINSLYDFIIQYLYIQISKEDPQIKFIQSQAIIKQIILTKSIMWQHEHEYRIFSPSPISEKVISIMKDTNKPQEQRAHMLKEFRKNKIGENNVNNFEYIKFGNNNTYQLKKTDFTNINLPIITLPSPIKIYLGWKFNDKNTNNMNIIKDFCNKHAITEFYKLTGKIDYQNNKFEIGPNLLS